MASASVLLSEEQFLCSICLEVFTDPITTPCGHNYCKTCITHHWDTTDVRKCPLCSKTLSYLYRRPELFVNKVLSEMADQFRKSKQLKQTSSTNQEPAKRDEVSCDICTETKLKALKSCMVCLASYCETHLEPHQRVMLLKQHRLINPVKNLEVFMCKKHIKPLELFCKTDNMCVCQFCTVSDHKLHDIVSLEEEYERKKTELGKTEAEVQQMIQERQVKIQEVKHSVELSKKDADSEIADSVQVFTALISCIERSQAEVIDVIEEKQKTTEIHAEDFIKKLQQEITELKKRSSELNQLSQAEDPLHLLQNFTSINTPPPTKDWTNVNLHPSSYGTLRPAVAWLVPTLSQELNKELSDVQLRTIQQYAVDVTLDLDTAHCELILSEDGKQAHHREWKNLPGKNIFSQFVFVLGKQRFSSGRIYYEVRVKGNTGWLLGVARESINRKLETITLNPQNGYWTIMNKIEDGLGGMHQALAEWNYVFYAWKLHKVGVFVDYEAGLVSFYNAETRVHLYSFTDCTFTDKLYPIFSPGLKYKGYIKICDLI